jgi:hypothetical protein
MNAGMPAQLPFPPILPAAIHPFGVTDPLAGY